LAVSVEVVGTGNRRNSTDEVNLPRLMAPIKFQDHGMILVEISFGAAEPGLQRRYNGSIQPLVGMEHDRQHPLRIGTVENRFVYRGLALAGKDLADISEPR
jgi:hypothetical protein